MDAVPTPSTLDDTVALVQQLDVMTRVAIAGARADSPLPIAEYATLAAIVDNPGVSAAQIARERGLNRSTTSRQLKALRDRDLVTIEDSAGSYRLSAMPAGDQLVSDIRVRAATRVAARVKGWPAADVQALTTLLDRYLAASALPD